MEGKKQRCGTCRWWELNRLGTYKPCFFDVNVPDSVSEYIEKVDMRENQGTNCPCYEKRKDDERKTKTVRR